MKTHGKPLSHAMNHWKQNFIRSHDPHPVTKLVETKNNVHHDCYCQPAWKGSCHLRSMTFSFTFSTFMHHGRHARTSASNSQLLLIYFHHVSDHPATSSASKRAAMTTTTRSDLRPTGRMRHPEASKRTSFPTSESWLVCGSCFMMKWWLPMIWKKWFVVLEIGYN